MKQALVLAAAPASAVKLLWVNQTQIADVKTGLPHSKLLELDLESQTSRIVNDELLSTHTYVKGSIVCDGTWYGISSDFGECSCNSITAIDLSSGKIMFTKEVPNQRYIYNLKCEEDPGKLLAASQGADETWGLVRMDLVPEEIVVDVVGAFPESVIWDGYSSIFSFGDDFLQGTFPRKGALVTDFNTGDVHRINVKTGAVTTQKIRGTPGFPMWIGADNAKGVFCKHECSSIDVCSVDMGSTEVVVSNCASQDRTWFTNGKPEPVQCGPEGLFYFLSRGARTYDYEPIFGADMQTGALSDVFHLNYHFAASPEEVSDWGDGSLTCASSASSSALV